MRAGRGIPKLSSGEAKSSRTMNKGSDHFEIPREAFWLALTWTWAVLVALFAGWLLGRPSGRDTVLTAWVLIFLVICLCVAWRSTMTLRINRVD